MMQRLFKNLKLLLTVALVTSLVSGCGSQPVSASYPLESVTQNGPQSSKVYRAENKTVPEVAHELAAQRKPEEISKEDPERMFLVYSDEWYHLQQDKQKPSDTLIEVDSKQFVQQNYNPSFLEGYILGSVLSNLFNSGGSYPGTYRGYTSRDTYHPSVDYRPPTTQEKKAVPPITTSGSGSVIKRGSGTSVGSGGSIFKKDPGTAPPSSGSTGTITKNSGSSSIFGGNSSSSGSSVFSSPKNNSPPKVRVGGFGKVTRRR